MILTKLRRPALILLTAALTSSCFTGVESTPRITVPQKELTPVTAEDTLLIGATREPFAMWREGKRFAVTDNRLKLLLGATAPDQPLEGRIIEFRRYDEGVSPSGTPLTRLTLTSPGIDGEMRLPLTGSPQALAQRSPGVEIPFAVEMQMVEKADSLLRGRTFYVLTPTWRDHSDNIIDRGRKFVAVRIDSVLPGTTAAPLRLDFTDTASGERASLFITPDPAARSPRTFARFFSITSPRLRYPDISDAHWQMIIEGKIADGMTRSECRLALGSPKEVTRHTNYSIMQERWTYENGVWLLFEDDTLIDHRK